MTNGEISGLKEVARDYLRIGLWINFGQYFHNCTKIKSVIWFSDLETFGSLSI